MFQNLSSAILLAKPEESLAKGSFADAQDEVRNSGDGNKFTPSQPLPHPGKELFPRPTGEGRVRGQNSPNNVILRTQSEESLTKTEGQSLPPTKAKCAFTLAEILITLGVIGVVAAMTIPGLMTAYKAHQFRSQFLKSYSVVQQVIRHMQADDIALDSGMRSQVKNYLAGATYCGASSTIINHAPDDSPCFYAKSGLYKTYDGKKTVTGGEMDDGQYVLPDGTNILFEWDTTHFSDGTHLWIYIDINGYKNKPNRWGVDLFTFQVINGEVLAFGDPGTVYTQVSGEYSEVTVEKYCNINNPSKLNGLACTHLAKSDASYFKRAVKLK